MRTYASKTVPGQKIREIGRVEACETARRSVTAERVAMRQLQEKAEKKGADAIVEFKLTNNLIFAGNECTVTGVAVQFID